MAKSKPKILIAASIYPPDAGGPAIHARAQLEGFQKFGFQTKVSALAHYRSYPFGIRHVLFFLSLVRSAPFYDVIYAHDAIGAGIPALIAARMFGKPIMVRIGGDIPWERKAESEETDLSMLEWYKNGNHVGDRLFTFSGWLMRRVDAIVVTSEILSDLYKHFYKISTPIYVIPNPIPAVDKNTEKKTERKIVYASRLVAYKNLSFVLRVLSKVLPRYPDTSLVIMGDGPDRAMLEKTAEDLKIQDQVKFTGSVSQSQVLNQTSSCLFTIGPALTEFNPNYILQGIASGKPFLISRENGLPFDVPEMFKFDARDERELQERLEEILDPDGYSKALELVNALHFKMSWDNNLEANANIIKHLLK